MKKVMVVFGTRPEAIKMCPVIMELRKHTDIFQTVVCVTGQHRQMLDQVLRFFGVVPDIDLDIMKQEQTLEGITQAVLAGMSDVLARETTDVVLVHGDTTTTYAAALAAFYKKIPVGHVEAGLRTRDIMSPYPEEYNRRATSLITQYHFAPTEWAADNLRKESIDPESIFVTGNTIVDALKYTVTEDFQHEALDWAGRNRVILFTAHRRENHGKPMRDIFSALLRIADEFADVRVIYPVHYNPAVYQIAHKMLGGHPRIKLIEPLDIMEFHNMLARCYLVMTDSGGIQEEAPSFSKPVLVMREVTERPEGVRAGVLRLVGTGREAIYENAADLLMTKYEYDKMTSRGNPYGDGTASERIVDLLLKIS